MPHTMLVTNESDETVESCVYYAGQNFKPFVLNPGDSISLVRITPQMETQIKEGKLSSRKAGNPARVPNVPSQVGDGVAVPPSPTVVYSRDEHSANAIWVDGRPICRRVFTGTTAGGTETAVALDFDFNDVISLRARVVNIHGACLGTESGDALLSVYIDGTDNLVLSHGREDYHNCPYVIIFEYTR